MATGMIRIYVILKIALIFLALSVYSMLGYGSIKNENINVAVASNFLSTAKELKLAFENKTPYLINIITASTGQLSHQILNGAPFDVFLSANKQHPEFLLDKLKLNSKNLFLYAQGSLVLISRNPVNNFPDFSDSLKDTHKAYTKLERDIISQIITQANKVAIANSKLAPYGRATIEALTSLNLIESMKNKTVTGQNIAQTHQFFTSGSAEAAFIANSQFASLNLQNKDFSNKIKSIIPISNKLHKPIEQWGLRLTETAAAQAFIKFLSEPVAIKIITDNGYIVINDDPKKL
ncbi:MAG: molybdate transport system substrate-binding protein [Bermanella sp.]